MKEKNIIFCITALFILTMGSTLYAGDYQIGPGDVLGISVWKNPDLTKQLSVLPDGTIHFPLIKELQVSGLTIAQIEKMISGRLEKYIPDPELFISVLQVNSMLIYVIGKVNSPGRFTINTNIDVLQALAVAGGLNPFAKEKQITVFRKQDGKTQIFNFNYDDVSKGKKLEQNIMLKKGDVIVVR
jgi:polysaccharide biosynthesis/export protein